MVNKHEIRIGNRLVLQDGVTQLQVDSIFPANDIGDYAVLSEEGKTFNCKYLHGIPLTPEILERCGFNKRRDGVYKSLEGTLLTIYLIDGKLTIQDYDWYEEELKHIKYLHQIQNFIHSLTGEELVYQPIKELT